MTESARRFADEHPGLEQEIRLLYPASSFGTPMDVAKCALFLASEDSNFINGATVVVDGGATAVHRLPLCCRRSSDKPLRTSRSGTIA